MKFDFGGFFTHLGVAVLAGAAGMYLAKRAGVSSVPVTAGTVGAGAADTALQVLLQQLASASAIKQ